MLALLAALLAGPAWAQACDDCDEDGFTVGEGDCDDEDPAVHPGAVEVCGNGVDDDCDGADDVGEECDPDRVGGSLAGGSTCGAGGYAVLLFLPWWGRRRR